MGKGSITLKPDGIRINGQPVLLLTSSLFYFRIPRELWRERMLQVKQAGYNAIDVYFPWNNHELAEGIWDFHNERDVHSFLEVAHEVGLWVIARPGPYICSEWDGGGLPAYLFTKPGIRLRDNDLGYLKYVRSWYEQILPILSGFQVTNGGNVLMVQLENELDFYDCQDRSGYIAALKEMALQQGISVPLIACAGQGDLPSSTGLVPGVIPTLNFYFQNTESNLEERILYYYQLLASQGFPLCVTETNKSHLALRRLLSAGVKMLGPYLQVGGTNFGFTNAVNNWGNPISFLTSDYDGGGMLTRNGQPRAEYYEARIFTHLIRTMGESLALAQPDTKVDTHWESHYQIGEPNPKVLALSGGGWLVALPNLTSEEVSGTVSFNGSIFPQHTRLIVGALRCPLLPYEIPLSSWGIPGKLAYATGELVLAENTQNQSVLVYCADGECELAFDLPGWVEIKSTTFQVYQEGNRHILCANNLPGSISLASIQLENQKCIQVYSITRENASLLEGLDPSGQMIFSKLYEVPRPSGLQISWFAAQMDCDDPFCFISSIDCGSEPKFLEEKGIQRGYGWYRSILPAISACRGLLLKNASDVISVMTGSRYHGTYTPSGRDLFIPFAEREITTGEVPVVVRAEIWGHSNFDDDCLPAMHIGAMRGISAVDAITSIRDLKSNWFYQVRSLIPAESIEPEWPCLNWGGWSSNDQPMRGVYHKWIMPERGSAVNILSFHELQADAWVYVDGCYVGKIDVWHPVLDITSTLTIEKRSRLSIAVERDHHQSIGEVFLLEGVPILNWSLAGFDESQLIRSSEHLRSRSQEIELPYYLASGNVTWMYGTFHLDAGEKRGIELKILGKNVKITSFLNDRMVSRLWLSSPARPIMVGGEDDLIFLPQPWMVNGRNTLSFMVEAITKDEPGEVTEILRVG